jgi:heme oxygenase
MRALTGALHQQAEASGVVAAMLGGQITRPAYALYLRNLLPAYQTMEQALRRLQDHPMFAALALPALYRERPIIADLEALSGPAWAAMLPLLPSGQQYADRIAFAGSGDGALLIAHVYTRYLGDLSGGQIVGRRLASAFGSHSPVLDFTRFPAIPDLPAFTARFRSALNQAGALLGDSDAVAAEAIVAFRKNIDISVDVYNACEQTAGKKLVLQPKI